MKTTHPRQSLRVQFGTFQFEADGPADVVQRQYDQALKVFMDTGAPMGPQGTLIRIKPEVLAAREELLRRQGTPAAEAKP